MKLFIQIYLLVFAILCLATYSNAQITIQVPGASNPWLAGMPEGTTAEAGDRAPAQSPVLVPLKLAVGQWLEFSRIAGSVSHGPGLRGFGAEGDLKHIVWHAAHAEHSKSDVVAPVNSLVGVFLGETFPAGVTPVRLDFSAPAARAYTELHPVLRQTFFIGDGMADANQRQRMYVPQGATRLFLGTMDGFGWVENQGAFTVTVELFGTPILLIADKSAGPELISPKNGDVLDNGCQDRKNGILHAFEWSEVPGAQRYHLYVKGPSARIPVIDDSNITTTGYTRWEQGSYIVIGNGKGWTWKVRAMVQGQWTDWSSDRTFDVEPVDTDCRSGATR